MDKFEEKISKEERKILRSFRKGKEETENIRNKTGLAHTKFDALMQNMKNKGIVELRFSAGKMSAKLTG